MELSLANSAQDRTASTVGRHGYGNSTDGNLLSPH